jgi:hypothetical protein
MGRGVNCLNFPPNALEGFVNSIPHLSTGKRKVFHAFRFCCELPFDPLFYVSPKGRNVFLALALGKPRKLGAWPTISKIEFFVFPSTVSTEADPCRIAISRPALLLFSLRQAILSSLRAGLQFIIADLLF